MTISAPSHTTQGNVKILYCPNFLRLEITNFKSLIHKSSAHLYCGWRLPRRNGIASEGTNNLTEYPQIRQSQWPKHKTAAPALAKEGLWVCFHSAITNLTALPSWGPSLQLFPWCSWRRSAAVQMHTIQYCWLQHGKNGPFLASSRSDCPTAAGLKRQQIPGIKLKLTVLSRHCCLQQDFVSG